MLVYMLYGLIEGDCNDGGAHIYISNSLVIPKICKSKVMVMSDVYMWGTYVKMKDSST